MPRPDLPAGGGPLLPCQGPFLPVAGQAWDGSAACSLLCHEHQRRRRRGSSFDQEGVEDAPANIRASGLTRYRQSHLHTTLRPLGGPSLFVPEAVT